MIDMNHVFKKYDNGIVALNDIDVHIDKGEFVYIVGPSGAGKSTFIKLLNREVLPTTGDIHVGKFHVNKLKSKEIPLLRRFSSVVFQDFRLLPKKTVYENVAYAMEVIEKNPKEIQPRVMEVLELVGLKHKVRMFPDELSGGEQQRVSIARALANSPSVIVADEPTGNLDPETSWEIMDVFDEINRQGTTVIMATHNSTIVNTMKRRVIAIENGRIIRDEERGEYGYENEYLPETY